jgi:hypothetical protein
VERLPSLVIRAQALARQAGFALTREEAGPGRPSACLPGVASAVRELFAADPRIEVVTGDALRVMPGRGPSTCFSPTAGCATVPDSPRWSARCWSEPERTRRIYD